jgi:outer membrane protein TolC
MKQQRLVVLAPILMVVATAPSVSAQSIHLDAETAAEMAIKASALTEAASDRVEASQSKVKAADAARLPLLSLDAHIAYQNEVPEFSAPVGGPSKPPTVIFPNIQNTYSAEIGVSQPIYTGGAIAAGRDGARNDESAATWSQRLTALDLANSARMLFWSAVAASAGVEVAQAQLKRSQRLLEDARALREAGMAVNADVYAAEARFAGAEVDLIRTRNEKAQAMEQLRSLLGLADNTSLTLDDARNDQIPGAPLPLEELERQALERRPELRITDARIEGLGAQARSIKSERFPMVAATGHWKVARPNQRFLPLEDVVNDSWRVGAVASWRFYDGSRTKAQVATVNAEQRALQHDRGEIERLILLDVATARLELQSAREAVAAADASAKAADAWEEASSERYAAGLAMLAELLDAQADLSAAELAQVRTRATAWMAEAALMRAVGQ